MKRILVFGMTENPGGVESFLINYYRHLDRSRIRFDFLCNTHDSVAYEDELLNMGSRTYHITARSTSPAKYRKELKRLFDRHASEWDAIWVNVCSLANIDYLIMAKKYGIKKRIIHSHNSQNMDSRLRGLLHKWNRRKLSRYATDFWACSEDAARWFYTGKELRRCVVIHNAIDVDRLAFCSEKRERIRREYGWGDRRIIGNIGRLHFQKNQTFILEIFKEYLKVNPNSLLVLVGQGEDEAKLRSLADSLQIEDKVFFAGVQRDIQAWLSGFDLFLFPSKFEGLSIAALEAQANGIPILASRKVIPEEVKMNRNFHFYSLEEDAASWSRQIEILRDEERIPYDEIKATFVRLGYDISSEAKKLEKMLLVRKTRK